MPTDIAPPLADGRYRLIRQIGMGGMATVYEGIDTRLQVRRAIKVLDPALLARKAIRGRFEAEARTMARLTHPRIVTVHDVGCEGDRAYIVMELIEGGSFADHLERRGPLTTVDACLAISSVLEALEHAHQAGVVHRDIKPQNMLNGSDGLAKLGDFGIAMLTTDDAAPNTRTGISMGTPSYMPPEQVKDTKSVGPTADIYATGATLYALLTDREPANLFAAEVRDELLKGLPPDVAAVIERATRYRPEDRYASAAEMHEALRSVLAGLSVHTAELPRALPLTSLPRMSFESSTWAMPEPDVVRPVTPTSKPPPRPRVWLAPGVVGASLLFVGSVALVAWWGVGPAPVVNSADAQVSALLAQAERAGADGEWAVVNQLVEDAIKLNVDDPALIARETALGIRAFRELRLGAARRALEAGDLGAVEAAAGQLASDDPDAASLLAEVARRRSLAATPGEPITPVEAVAVVSSPAAPIKRAPEALRPPVAVVGPAEPIAPAVEPPGPAPVVNPPAVTSPPVTQPAATPPAAPDRAAVVAAARATLSPRVRARNLDDLRRSLAEIEYTASRAGLVNAEGATTLLAADLIGTFSPGVAIDLYPQSVFDAIAAGDGLTAAKVRSAVGRANHP